MTYTYDGEDRVTQILYSTGGTNTFAYNGDGQRVRRVGSDGTTDFVYDGANLLVEKNTTRGTLYHLPGIGVTYSTGYRLFTRENGLGSMVAQTDPSGSTVSRWEYDAYGMARYGGAATGATDPQLLKFAGKHGYQSDPDSGMDLLGARYYIPVLGRFSRRSAP